MKRNVLWLFLTGLLASALVLSSCGPAEEEEVTEEPAVEEPAADEPIYGGTLTPAFSVQNWAGGPTGWDMVKWTWMGHAYQSFITDSLLMGDMTKGPIGTGEFSFASTDFIPDAAVTGALADSWEFPQPDIARFHIRKGVTWHNRPPTNGRALTVDDLVWAFTRTIGFEEGKGRWPRHNFIKEVRKVDEDTLEFVFTDPLAFWGYEVAWGPYLLAYPPESEKLGLDDWHNISGTGPFWIEDYISDVEIVFARNPDWWGTWTHKGKTYQLPFLDKIVIPIIPEQSARVAAFRTGKLDIYQMAGMTTKRDLLEVSPELADVLESRQVMRGGGWHFHFPWGKEPFNDIRVRKAINMAIDRQALIDAFYEGVGMIYYWPLQPSDGPTLFTPLEATPEIQEYMTYNPDKAKQLLAEAGYPNGFQMEFIMSTGDLTPDFGGMLQEFWAAIGIEADLKIMEQATIQAIGFDKSFTGLISAGLQARPQSFNDMTCEHAYNFGGWCDDEWEKKWDIAKTTPGIEARDPLLKELYVELKRTVPDVLMPSGAEWTAWWPWVKNYGGETSLGFHKHNYWAWAWIDEELKKEMGY